MAGESLWVRLADRGKEAIKSWILNIRQDRDEARDRNPVLRFQTIPDQAFLDILHEAIEAMKTDIEGYAYDRESLAIEYEESARRFHPKLAYQTLEQLLEASRAEQWYQLTDYHWLLLYEALEVYCGLFNEGEWAEFDVGKRYGLRYIDFHAVIDLYFWDTDFLISEEESSRMGLEGRKWLTINPETFGLIQVMAPHLEELSLKPVPADDEEPENLYRPGSTRYPDWDLVPDDPDDAENN